MASTSWDAATEATTPPREAWEHELTWATKTNSIFVAVATTPMQVLSIPRHWVWLAGAWQRVR